MGVLSDSWCFCSGGGKSERMKAAIYAGKGPAMARISGGGGVSGTGFLIHRNLLLTTHVNLPSVTAAEAAEIRFQSGVGASLYPHRYFITSSVLDLTIVGIDAMDCDLISQSQQPHYLKTCSKPNLELGSSVYLLGYTNTNELAIGEGKVNIATDNLIKLSTDGATLTLGSAGFDQQGNLAFMVCDPMKLATSPNTRSTSTSPSSFNSLKKDPPMQFGIPIPIICDWLNQHWEGNLDELNKPKLPIIRLMSTGQKSEHSCTSFTKRSVFKSAEPANEGSPSSSSNVISKTRNFENENTAHEKGIPPPEIYDTPKLTSVPARKRDTSPIQLLDINFPPKLAKPPINLESIKKLREEDERQLSADMADADLVSTDSVNGPQSEVQSCSSPMVVLEEPNEYSSEGETTMYSAETAESRNIPSPRGGRLQQVGRSQSCVNYNRRGAVEKYPLARKALLEKQRSFMQGRNDYYSPTVSSIMKKRLNIEQPRRSRPSPSVVHSSSPRWNI